ncbi:hypothetical protein CHUAL_013764 [Chamberlinius hualienensis]
MAASESVCSRGDNGISESSVILTDVFEVNRKRQKVTLTATSITWESDLEPKSCERVLLEEVVAVTPAELVSQGCHLAPITRWSAKTNSSSLNVDGFQLHFINRLWKYRWKLDSIIFAHHDCDTLHLWTNSIQNILKSYAHRPQRLLVFINPFGGKKQAVNIYEKKVQPIFNLARIDAHVIITQRANHAKDLLLEMPLNKVDGVIGVGGDGTFNEILNGLILRSQRDVGVDANDQNATLIKPKLRVGIIPGGSTDAMAFVTSGTNDPITAALHIVLGDNLGVDVSSVHNSNKLLLYCTTMLAYGYFGDILKASEKCRWMGPHRYDWSGFKQLLRLKSYKGEIIYNCDPKPQSSPVDGQRCLAGCDICASALEHLNGNNKDNESGWKTVSGKFVGVNTATTSCSCMRTTKGISPSAHVGDGYTDLILVSKCSKLNYLRYLLSVASPCLTPFNLDFVKVYRVREFHFKSIRRIVCSSEESRVWEAIQISRQELEQPVSPADVSVWNCDGEIISEPAIGVKVHCQLVNFFARGIEDVSGSFQSDSYHF